MARRKAAATSKPPRRGPLRWIGSLIRILTAVTLGYLLACTLLLLAYRVVLPPATTVQLQRMTSRPCLLTLLVCLKRSL